MNPNSEKFSICNQLQILSEKVQSYPSNLTESQLSEISLCLKKIVKLRQRLDDLNSGTLAQSSPEPVKTGEGA